MRIARLVLAPAALAVVLTSPSAARAEDAGATLTLELGGKPLALRLVPKGKFVMGSPATEAGREPDETAHPVMLTHDVWMTAAPITRGLFEAFVRDTGYRTEAEKGTSGGHGWDGKALVQKKQYTWASPGFAQTDEHPVVLVTWGDANAFASWATKGLRRRVRLPTEAEWERAARAGTAGRHPAGESDEAIVAAGWLKPNAGDGTRPVGSKPPNAWGFFDMTGNSYEWCSDVYVPYGKDPLVDPEIAGAPGAEVERRVLRGGSWMRDPRKARPAARYRATAGTRNAENGFRVVVTDEEEIAPGLLTPGAGSDGTPATLPGAKAPGGSGSVTWALLAVPAAAVAAMITWVVARRGKAPGITTEARPDGFVIRAPRYPRGTRVRYEAVVSGTPVSDVVPLSGGRETFVYTGARPAGVRVVEVVPVAGGYRSSGQASRHERDHDVGRAMAAHHVYTTRDEPTYEPPRAY